MLSHGDFGRFRQWAPLYRDWVNLKNGLLNQSAPRIKVSDYHFEAIYQAKVIV